MLSSRIPKTSGLVGRGVENMLLNFHDTSLNIIFFVHFLCLSTRCSQWFIPEPCFYGKWTVFAMIKGRIQKRMFFFKPEFEFRLGTLPRHAVGLSFLLFYQRETDSISSTKFPYSIIPEWELRGWSEISIPPHINNSKRSSRPLHLLHYDWWWRGCRVRNTFLRRPINKEMFDKNLIILLSKGW